jgi:hypothetical protein
VSVLIAADLDRTLIYSRAALDLTEGALPPLACVEWRGGEQVGFMTEVAAGLLAELAGRTVLVPVTTRLPDQLARVRLPAPPSRFAIAANGGVLLINGEPDLGWRRRVARTVAESASLSDVWSYIRQNCSPSWRVKLRNADGLFCYAVLAEAGAPAGFVSEASAWAEERGWTVSAQERKLYWVPRGLTKSAAVAEVASRVGADLVLAAGDSLLDQDLLDRADLGIHPAHGELFSSGWSAPHVRCTAATGVLAGQQILEWFTQQVAERAAGRRASGERR